MCFTSKLKHFAPTELGNSFDLPFYKHSAPNGAKNENTGEVVTSPVFIRRKNRTYSASPTTSAVSSASMSPASSSTSLTVAMTVWATG